MPTKSLHRESLDLTLAAARSVTVDRLSAPTPCAGWVVADLLDHMTVQNLGFAAAARGKGADPELWIGGGLRTDPVADLVASAAVVVEAFAEPGVSERPFTLPELSGSDFPGSQAVVMHTVDSVLHAWDLARSLGTDIAPSAELVRFTLELGEQIPDGDRRLEPGSPFGPRLQVADTAPTLDRALALYGRSPTWPG
ncbi:TIGR03086 family metal-binding protein [Pseudonocardia pini]|uniref:TIGR03086 family metal-binding protein n=1 Tax=Pseudonocardia pini TaxID=2758030 RepID=UPI0015F0AA6D|nr:TIGR03086 family metal-binding protein [Pseudonocardia pini]